MTDKERRAQAVADMDSLIRQRLKSVRSQKGVNQSDLATDLGIVPQQYHKYESGVLRLSAGMMTKIAESLDCSVTDLIPVPEKSAPKLDRESRLDIIKQELTIMILDQHDEHILIAIKTLLTKA